MFPSSYKLMGKDNTVYKNVSMPHIRQEGVEGNCLECGPDYMRLNPSSATYWCATFDKLLNISVSYFLYL